jgi:hypothetical protein
MADRAGAALQVVTPSDCVVRSGLPESPAVELSARYGVRGQTFHPVRKVGEIGRLAAHMEVNLPLTKLPSASLED